MSDDLTKICHGAKPFCHRIPQDFGATLPLSVTLFLPRPKSTRTNLPYLSR